MSHSKRKSHMRTLVTVALTFLATCYTAAHYPTMPHKVCDGMQSAYNASADAFAHTGNPIASK